MYKVSIWCTVFSSLLVSGILDVTYWSCNQQTFALLPPVCGDNKLKGETKLQISYESCQIRLILRLASKKCGCYLINICHKSCQDSYLSKVFQSMGK